jgi:hypothetical protein
LQVRRIGPRPGRPDGSILGWRLVVDLDQASAPQIVAFETAEMLDVLFLLHTMGFVGRQFPETDLAGHEIRLSGIRLRVHEPALSENRVSE